MNDFALTGTFVAVAMLALFALVIGFILIYRNRLNNASGEALRQKYTGKNVYEARNKYPEVNVFKLTQPIWMFGLVAAMAMTLFAFSYTAYEDRVDIPDGALDFEEEIEIEPPRTAKPPPPPPPPPPPVIEEVPEEEIEEEDEPVFESMDIDEETAIEEPEAPVEEDAPPPPPPPPPPPAEEEIFKVVEQMPRFPGCEDSGGTKEEIAKCAEDKMLQFIYKNLKYPAIARENGVDGMVVLQFVVDKSGNVTDAKVVRDIGAGCGDAAMKVVKQMPQWVPGKQRGRAVKVLYTLPVRFKLEG